MVEIFESTFLLKDPNVWPEPERSFCLRDLLGAV
ncbi:hypothetical protein RDI58_011126 [Solanum bulbocastanum]|uniref:Uncharacterized protein n=1 Tax=Solanum bulbocastanum TaxID=147425 RepID=A0AAN8TRW7_SOLBU